MKKILVLGLLFLSFYGFGQNDTISEKDEEKLLNAMSKMFNSEFDIEIDASVYSVNQGNSYFTEDEKSAIIAMLVPASFEKMKADMNKDKKKEGLKTLEKGELVMNGKRVLFVKQLLEKEGEEYIIYIYCKEHNEESSLTMTSFFENAKESVYKPHIDKAIASLKLKE